MGLPCSKVIIQDTEVKRDNLNASSLSLKKQINKVFFYLSTCWWVLFSCKSLVQGGKIPGTSKAPQQLSRYSTQVDSPIVSVPQSQQGLAIFADSSFFPNPNPHLLSEIQVFTLSIEFFVARDGWQKGLEGFCSSAEQPKPQRECSRKACSDNQVPGVNKMENDRPD